MALETLDGVKEIGGFKVVCMDDIKKEVPALFNESGQMDYKFFEKEIRPYNFIYVRKDVNSLSFTLQDGPVKEVGVNGCQIDTILEAAWLILKGLNEKFVSVYNDSALWHLSMALENLGLRKAEREKKGIEGTSKKVSNEEN